MTAPITPRAAGNAPAGMVGTRVPYTRSPTSGLAENKFAKKQVPITAMRKAKNASSFLIPK